MCVSVFFIMKHDVFLSMLATMFSNEAVAFLFNLCFMCALLLVLFKLSHGREGIIADDVHAPN